MELVFLGLHHILGVNSPTKIRPRSWVLTEFHSMQDGDWATSLRKFSAS